MLPFPLKLGNTGCGTAGPSGQCHKLRGNIVGNGDRGTSCHFLAARCAPESPAGASLTLQERTRGFSNIGHTASVGRTGPKRVLLDSTVCDTVLPVPGGALPTPSLFPPFARYVCSRAQPNLQEVQGGSHSDRRPRAPATQSRGSECGRWTSSLLVPWHWTVTFPGLTPGRLPLDPAIALYRALQKFEETSDFEGPRGIILGHLQEVLQSSSGSDRELSGAQRSMGGRSFPGGLPTVLWLLQESRPCLQSAGT